jgi:hypothetical protein
MIDLKDALRATEYNYRFHRDDTALRIYPLPQNQRPSQPPPVQELSATTFLKADKYQLSWRVSSGADRGDGLVAAELQVFIGNYTRPALVYDVCAFPDYTVAFEIKDSRNVYVLLRTRSRSVISVHSLHVLLARDTLLGKDPLMYEWDMERVARALKKQREVAARLQSMTSLFHWEPLKADVAEVLARWSDVFPLRPFTPHFQNTMLECVLQAPMLLATSRLGISGELQHDPGEPQPWSLLLGGRQLQPTTVLAQHLVWCFPDREIKITLRRDAPAPSRQMRFTLTGNSMVARTMPWFWLGYNMLSNVPFYSLWSIDPPELEFINWQDVLAVFDQIEEHFDGQNLVPQINLYDDS